MWVWPEVYQGEEEDARVLYNRYEVGLGGGVFGVQ